ncbi:MAG: hypothetical protein R2851_24360 [Caldilineaceae bacterium]
MSDVVIIVGVLSFTTSVDIVVGNGGVVFPYARRAGSARLCDTMVRSCHLRRGVGVDQGVLAGAEFLVDAPARRGWCCLRPTALRSRYPPAASQHWRAACLQRCCCGAPIRWADVSRSSGLVSAGRRSLRPIAGRSSGRGRRHRYLPASVHRKRLAAHGFQNVASQRQQRSPAVAQGRS